MRQLNGARGLSFAGDVRCPSGGGTNLEFLVLPVDGDVLLVGLDAVQVEGGGGAARLRPRVVLVTLTHGNPVKLPVNTRDASGTGKTAGKHAGHQALVKLATRGMHQALVKVATRGA